MSEGNRQDIGVVVGLLGSDATTFLMAAHELKSPLALIRQLAFALETDELSHHDYERIAKQIRLTSERSLRLTNDITRSSRTDTLFDLEPLNPITVCEEVAHELSPLYAAQGRRIEVRSRTRPPLLVGNRDLLKRILLNFGDNALHYSPGDEPTRFQVGQSGGNVRVGIRDFGPAVSSDTWRELSRRLQAQTIQPLSARPQSSGLGLYIAGQFARMMQGEIGAVRHRDGATFYVDMTASQQLSLL
jgi:signal transduction histidine kinase